MVEQCTAGCAVNGNIPGLTYRSQSNDLFISGRNLNTSSRGARSFVVCHGRPQLQGRLRRQPARRPALGEPGAEQPDYRVNNGVPNQLTMCINNYQNDLYMRDDGYLRAGAVDAQSPHAAGRPPLRPGVELGAGAAEGPVPFLPTPISFPKTPIVDSFKDITPRVAATYDLFGNGKTALKAHVRQVSRVDAHRSDLRPRQPDLAHHPERDPRVDRRQRQLQCRTATC